jgi:hypothetical protein
MDKVKVIIGHLTKYHFWVLWVLLLCIGLVSWFSASGSLTDQFEKFKADINTEKTNMESVVGTPSHPNLTVIEGMQAQADELRKQVYLLWRDLYTQQRKAVLTWPDALGSDFIDMIDRRKFGDRIDVQYLELYRDYVRERFQELPDIIGAEKIVDVGAASGPGRGVDRGPPRGGEGGVDPMEQETFLVEWRNQGELQEKLVWETTPSSVKVWVTQEDLWVYETLLNIIAAVNENAAPHTVKISVIERLSVGQQAADDASTSGRVAMLAGAAGEDAERGGRPPAGGPPVGGPRRRGEAIDPKALAAAEDAALTDGRYLNKEGLPLTGEEKPEVEEYKRIPILLELQMDYLQLPKLLAECANAPLPVEVNQIRVNPGSGGNAGANRGMGGQGRPPGRFAGGAGRGGPNGPQETAGRNHSHVIIQGVTYVFNPPDVLKLKVTPEQEQAWTPIEDPAATPKTPTPTTPAVAPADTEPTEPDAVPALEGPGDAPADGAAPVADDPAPPE